MHKKSSGGAREPRGASLNLPTTPLPTRCIRNHAHIFNRFIAMILYRKMGVALSRPFVLYGMLEKIRKIILDYCLLDANGIMQKSSTVFL